MCVAIAGLSAGTVLSGVLGLAGTAVTAIGQNRQAEATAQAAEYTGKQNALLAEDALRRGTQEEEAKRREIAALTARQKAVMAASNLDVTSGSPLAVLGDTAMLGQYDIGVIRDNAQRGEQYHRVNSELSTFEAANARSSGKIAAFGTVLGGVSSLADKWMKPQKTGTSAFEPRTVGLW